MSPSTPRFITIGLAIAALGLAGCVNTGGANGLFGETATRPKTILVADFVASPEVEAIDRGFSARMDRKGINYPILERKRRTLGRVNDEIVASAVATLREAGLDAQLGSEEGLTLNDESVVVSGRLRAGDQGKPAKNQQIGFGAGRGGVVADMTVSYFSGGGKKQLLAFNADAKAAGKSPAGKQAAARNTAIATVLAAEKAASEKLSPDVEAQARRLGLAVGEKVVAFAKEQSWLGTPEVAKAQPEERVKLPEPKLAQKQAAAKKPAAQKSAAQKPEAPENEEPPDTDVPDQPGKR
ncbi:MAG TPA: DUF4410 domain-containing protein [Pseudolabrys sp.]|nr:DUF4410 domain-containing protein [Pseudolabrys sp.]